MVSRITHREFWVLDVLVRRKNQVLTRAQIEEALYGWGEEVVRAMRLRYISTYCGAKFALI
jgi:DNA-binding response OmpR family regulator